MYSTKIEYARHTNFQRYTTALARGCGAVINLNMAAVITVSSRSAMTFFRETPLSMVIPFDMLMPGFHAVLGSTVVVAGFVHGVLHWVTLIANDSWTPGFKGTVSLFITGFLLFVAIAAIRVSSWKSVQRNHFEVFQVLHVGGAVLATALLLVHGLHRGVPSSWKWLVGPAALYILDQVYRILRERRSYLFVNKHSAAVQGCSTLRLRIPRVFHFQAGQYAELKVPSISSLQWHPFTIASAPHESEMVFYLKPAGDWTTELFQMFANRARQGIADDIEVHVRGPFGAPAQRVHEYEHLVLVGGGIGSTPFCSVVKSLHNWISNWSPTAMPESSSSYHMTTVSSESTSKSDAQEMQPNSRSSSQGSCSSAEDDENVLSSDVGFPPKEPVELLGRGKTATTAAATSFHTARANLVSVPSSDSTKSPTRPTVHWESSELWQNTSSSGSVWEDVSVATGQPSLSYWAALHDAYDDRTVSPTYRESLNLLVSMSFGSAALVRHAQAARNALNMSPTSAHSTSAADLTDISMFHEPRFLFLMFSKGMTVTMGLLWIVLARFMLAGYAAIFDAVSFNGPGLSIFTSSVALIIDTVFAAILTLAVVIPAALEFLEFGVPQALNLDTLGLTPIAVLSLVLNILALCNVGNNVSWIAGVHVIAVWGISAILIIVRLIHITGERFGQFDRVRKPPSVPKTVDFYWTSPTHEDDNWLVRELMPCLSSKQVRIHRYITRSRPESDPYANENIGIKTHYGRPDWVHEFNELAKFQENGASIGVFLCGPASMAHDVEAATVGAMRNSIVRGLQSGTHPMRTLEEVFGDAVSANEFTGENLDATESQAHGCNVKMVFHKERFS